jgi:hypothetical protein
MSLEELNDIAAIVHRRWKAWQTSAVRPVRAQALALRLEGRQTGRTESTITQPDLFQRTPTRLRWQQAAAQRSISVPTQAQLASHQVHTHLTTGEQIQLLIRFDQLIGI